VYFIYPETAGVRLEDMDAIFGDATAAPTPATLRAADADGENGSLLGAASPVPSMDLRRGVFGAGSYGNSPSGYDGLGSPASAIPGLEIDPPHVQIKNGKPQYRRAEGGGASTPSQSADAGEGVGGWIGRIVRRGAGDVGKGRNASYKPLDQDDE
jgi:hypothetical protein